MYCRTFVKLKNIFKYCVRILGVMLLVNSIPSCGVRSANNDDGLASDRAERDSLLILELPLPEIPESMTQPDQKIDYALSHFWDALDFQDTVRVYNRDFMEQNFSNFIHLLSHAAPETSKKAIRILLDKASINSKGLTNIAEIADLYLYEPNSPFKNEDLYALFLNEYRENDLFDTAHRLRYEDQLEEVSKNVRGTLATDFDYVTTDGLRRTLYGTKVSGRILLVFYDPDCDHCKDILSSLFISDKLNGMIKDGELTPLAIYSGDDLELWKKKATDFPSIWTVGYNQGVIEENDLYVLRALPVIYILDADKTVVEKDLPFTALL